MRHQATATQHAGPTTAPAPTQPAAPPVIIQKVNSLWAFTVDHWPLAVVALVALAAFIFLPRFQELAYGLLRVALVALFIALIIYVWFKDTIREYLSSGAFVAEFRALEARHRVAVTITILVVISWIVVECIVHP